MKFRRIISMFLVVLFMISMCTMTVGAADTSNESGTVAEKVTYTYYTASGVERIRYFKHDDLGWKDEISVFDTPTKKLEYMDLRLQKDGYQLYIDEFSGEVACKNLLTEEVLFTNPYNVANSKAAKDRNFDLMSQIIIQYKDKSIGTLQTFYSFEEASLRGQLKVKNIKNGLRVEYTIGREEAKMLVPRMIEVNRFETRILAVMEEQLKDEGGRDCLKFQKVEKFYLKYDTNDAVNDDDFDKMIATFPICRKMAIYALDGETSTVQMAQIELLIKTYAPSYSYEDLDYDHELTEYEGEEQSPPLFKMALEYTIGADGLTVTLPANGLRFDESRYTLENISILPYMGSGFTPNPGYTFFPDGSGALFDFEDLANTSETKISGQVYGTDYAYQTITATHQEVIRYPVFGLTETQTLASIAPDGSQKIEEIDRGYLAIIEEGDSLAKLTSAHGGKTHFCHSIKMEYYPRPKDSYSIQDAISSTSSGSGAMWEVVSTRKYTGNYKIKYIMLTDDDVAARIQHDMPEGEVFNYYTTSYVGMAKAYQDYLIANGTLSKLTEEDVSDDIPLYLNVFGAIDTTEKIMSIPVDVTVPLTSFQDIMTMYADLKEQGITNVNFKLTGFANGGMFSTVPYRLDWEKAVGGKNDFQLLLEDAKTNGYKVFPDFDFVYISASGLFDGMSLRKHAVKSIDNRYTSRREYSATKQSFVSYYELCLSPAYFDHFYTKLTENYLKFFGDDYETSISVGTLGSDLNSDFDEEDPYNREDSKAYTIEAFQYLAENYDNVMTSGGNAYTWKYVDYILDVPLDSSRFIKASASVPFMGMVLHGYVQFAGTPINMEGNIDYAFLKAIENGSSINFILSYQNTTTLKENYRLSKYYSVRYDIWFDDVVEIYKELNSLLSSVQLETIVDHEFIIGNRVPDLDEIAEDLDNAIIDSILEEAGALDAQEKEYLATILSARQTIRRNSESVYLLIDDLEAYLDSITRLTGYEVDANGNVSFTNVQLNAAIATFEEKVQNFIKVYNGGTAAGSKLGEASRDVNTAARALLALYDQTQSNSINYIADLAYQADLEARTAYNKAIEAYEILANVDGISDYIKELAWSLIETTSEAVARVGTLAPGIYEIAQGAYYHAVSGTSDLYDANGNKVCEVNTYQFYLFAMCEYLSVKPTTRLNAEYLLQRYEIGLAKTDLTASAALDQIRTTLQIDGLGDVPNYAELFANAVAKTNSHPGFMDRYESFIDARDNYFAVYEKYVKKQATSVELEAALKPLTVAATYLNDEYNYLRGIFEAKAKTANTLSPLFEEALRDTVRDTINTFSAAYVAYLNEANPAAADLAALQATADALNDLFDTLTPQYAIIPKNSAAGINANARNAQKHLQNLLSAYETAQAVYETLKNKQISTSDPHYAEYKASLEAAEEYVAYTKESYEAVVADAEEAMRLVNEAYANVEQMNENKLFLEVIADLEERAELDEDLLYVTNKLTSRINPFDYVAEEEEEIIPEDDEPPYTRYLSNDNNIVLVTYSNGARFLLNYCNYAVIVEIDNVTYRVEGQDYKQLPMAESEG